MKYEVKCPQCHKTSTFAPDNPYRPFCSERCKLIDLGQWAEGKYAIPVSQTEAIDSVESEAESNVEFETELGDKKNHKRV